jgi:hypothetical protein
MIQRRLWFETVIEPFSWFYKLVIPSNGTEIDPHSALRRFRQRIGAARLRGKLVQRALFTVWHRRAVSAARSGTFTASVRL